MQHILINSDRDLQLSAA